MEVVDAMQSSSQSETVADSGDDEEYVPESRPKPKNWSCGAKEEGEGEQSSEHPKGRQCEQRKVRSLSQQNIMLGSHALSANLCRWSNGWHCILFECFTQRHSGL